MKKYILVSSLLAIAATAQAITPKQGGYVGLGAVYAKPNNKLSVVTTDSVANPNTTDINTAKPSKTTYTGRLLGGYHAQWHNNVFLQAELFGQLADREQKTQTLVARNAGEQLSVKLRRNWTTGAALKVGYYFNDVFGAFVSAGPLYSQFKTTAGSTQGDAAVRSSSQTQKVWGTTFGGGVIYNVTDSVLLKAEYAYEGYRKFKTKPLQSYFAAGVTNANNQVTSKVHYNTFVISASYLF